MEGIRKLNFVATLGQLRMVTDVQIVGPQLELERAWLEKICKYAENQDMNRGIIFSTETFIAGLS